MPLRPSRSSAPPINASSMADIAFLLLIFFLVSTEITSESGILVKLPVYDPAAPISQVSADNTFNVKVNGEDALLVEGEAAEINVLRARLRTFLTNPRALANLPDDPRKAVVSLQNDRSTTYATYLAVYNELRAGYREVWDAAAVAEYGLSFADERLTDAARATIRERYPMVISEADPTDLLAGGG